jgi:hypothetical protein
MRQYVAMPRQDTDSLAPIYIPLYDISVGSEARDKTLDSAVLST